MFLITLDSISSTYTLIYSKKDNELSLILVIRNREIMQRMDEWGTLNSVNLVQKAS